MMDRRSFLAAAAPALVTTPAAALCTLPIGRTLDLTPAQRARFHYQAFASAMDELTADAHGWEILGAGHKRAFDARLGNGKPAGLLDQAWCHLRSVHYEVYPQLRNAAFMRHRPLDVLGSGE